VNTEIFNKIDGYLVEAKEAGLINQYGGLCTHHTDKDIPYGLSVIDPESCIGGEPASNIITGNDSHLVTAYFHNKTLRHRVVGRHNIPIMVIEIVVFTSKNLAGKHAIDYQEAFNLYKFLGNKLKGLKILPLENKKSEAFEIALLEVEELMLGNCTPSATSLNPKCY
jgi:hypothetical protein